MQATWCAAKVTAWVNWASTSTGAQAPNPAVATKRPSVTTATSCSQRSGLSSGNQRPWNQKKAISTATLTAHRPPTAALP
jgi:hypothetical protein